MLKTGMKAFDCFSTANAKKIVERNRTQLTSRALFVSSSECSELLLCSVWCRDEIIFHEKSDASMSREMAFRSLSHKLISGG
jgi:hypothetical protein